MTMRTSAARRIGASAIALAMCAVGAFAGPADSAGAVATTGKVTVRSGGSVSAVGASTALAENDVLTLAAGATTTVRFADGSSLELRGPAELSFIQLESGGRRVRLASGTITKADVGDVALEIQTPSGPSLVLQKATASASVSGSTSSFSLVSGKYAKVWSGGAATDLVGTWSNAPVVKAQPRSRPPVASVPTVVPSGDETASVGALVGNATVESGGQVSRVNAGTHFKPGDVVRVAAGSRLVTKFADGSSATLVGPAEMQYLQLAGQGRRVVLRSGVISEAFVRGVALEIQTPYDASLVLQNASGFARVAPGDRVLFQKLDGQTAQVFHEGKLQDLTGTWTLNVRSGASGGGARAPGATSAVGDTGVLQIAARTVAYTPKDDFDIDMLDNGGVRLTYRGDDYGIVQIGADSVFFLGPDDFIEIDGNGAVEAFSGVSHLYHSFADSVFYDEPVENASDASVSTPGRR